ncbi:hypothetical protein [Niallia sp. FSL M8-0099]|uniref:hypothetical protein n=1 Tax=Niallia sp. FSL M8-0099 TaxID=2954519 RepID=UPI0030FBEAD7
MEFDSLAKLLKHVEKKHFRPVMETVMAEMVKDEEQKAIDKTVYDAYKPGTEDGEPWVYKRRRDNGGLRSRDNMKVNVKRVGDGIELSVENITKGANGYEISEGIEYGTGYEYTSNRDGTADQYTSPRPFTQETEKEILSRDLHTKTMKQALKARGLDIE